MVTISLKDHMELKMWAILITFECENLACIRVWLFHLMVNLPKWSLALNTQNGLKIENQLSFLYLKSHMESTIWKFLVSFVCNNFTWSSTSHFP
jgi:hypothetical protein